VDRWETAKNQSREKRTDREQLRNKVERSGKRGVSEKTKEKEVDILWRQKKQSRKKSTHRRQLKKN
jgi:hypothetical protein